MIYPQIVYGRLNIYIYYNILSGGEFQVPLSCKILVKEVDSSHVRLQSPCLQDDILRLLATSEGDVLEDDTLVDKAHEAVYMCL